MPTATTLCVQPQITIALANSAEAAADAIWLTSAQEVDESWIDCGESPHSLTVQFRVGAYTQEDVDRVTLAVVSGDYGELLHYVQKTYDWNASLTPPQLFDTSIEYEFPPLPFKDSPGGLPVVVMALLVVGLIAVGAAALLG